MPAMIVAGYGPAISHAVALKFGKERGYSIALLCRTQSKLDDGVKALSAQGVKAAGYAVDLGKTDDVLSVMRKVKEDLGPIGILFWNGGGYPKSVFEATSEDIHTNITINVDSLLFATKEIQKELEATKGAVLVTGGGLGENTAFASDLAVQWGALTYALSKAAQRRLVWVLHSALKPLGIFVGEVTVNNVVKGTASDPAGQSSLTAEAVADAFATLFDKRDTAAMLIS